MTQLSPLSLKVLDCLKRVLVSLERLVSSGKSLIFKRIPYILRNIRYVLVTLKDIATFVPGYVYKLIVCVIALSFLTRMLRRGKNKQTKLQGKDEEGIQSGQDRERQVQKELDKLGPEFEVRENQGPTRPGETQDQQDSCCQDLTHHLAKSHDFRDFVFFELMRGYSRSLAENQTEEDHEPLN